MPLPLRDDQTRNRVRSDVGRIGKLADPQARLSHKLLDSLRTLETPDPPLLKQEREVIAVAWSKPTWFVTITTPSDSRQQIAYKFRRLLIPRIERKANRRKGPLIYFGTYAQSTGEAGWHVHILLWEEPYRKLWKAEAEAVGLGYLKAKPIGQTQIDIVKCTAYTMGQNLSVLGTDHHGANRRLAKGMHDYVHPKMSTLRDNNPKLFHGMIMAKDRSVSDETLIRALPILDKDRRGSIKRLDSRWVVGSRSQNDF